MINCYNLYIHGKRAKAPCGKCELWDKRAFGALCSVMMLSMITFAVSNRRALEGLSSSMALGGAVLMTHPIIHLIRTVLPDFKQMLFVAPFLLPLQQPGFYSLLSSSCSGPCPESLILEEHTGWHDGVACLKITAAKQHCEQSKTKGTLVLGVCVFVCICVPLGSWKGQQSLEGERTWYHPAHCSAVAWTTEDRTCSSLSPKMQTLHKVNRADWSSVFLLQLWLVEEHPRAGM